MVQGSGFKVWGRTSRGVSKSCSRCPQDVRDFGDLGLGGGGV